MTCHTTPVKQKQLFSLLIRSLHLFQSVGQSNKCRHLFTSSLLLINLILSLFLLKKHPRTHTHTCNWPKNRLFVSILFSPIILSMIDERQAKWLFRGQSQRIISPCVCSQECLFIRLSTKKLWMKMQHLKFLHCLWMNLQVFFSFHGYETLLFKWLRKSCSNEIKVSSTFLCL